MADHCAHCNGTELQYQMVTYQCLHCGELTRIDDHTAVMPVRQTVAPSPAERLRIMSPVEPDTYDEWYANNPNREGRIPNDYVRDLAEKGVTPPGVNDQYESTGETFYDRSA